MTNGDGDNVKSFIVDWSIRFPIDRWWRKKYNVPFNSKSHRESNFIDQLIDYEEDRFFDKLLSYEYEPGVGDFLSRRVASDEESIQSLREEFKDIDDGDE